MDMLILSYVIMFLHMFRLRYTSELAAIFEKWLQRTTVVTDRFVMSLEVRCSEVRLYRGSVFPSVSRLLQIEQNTSPLTADVFPKLLFQRH